LREFKLQRWTVSYSMLLLDCSSGLTACFIISLLIACLALNKSVTRPTITYALWLIECVCSIALYRRILDNTKNGNLYIFISFYAYAGASTYRVLHFKCLKQKSRKLWKIWKNVLDQSCIERSHEWKYKLDLEWPFQGQVNIIDIFLNGTPIFYYIFL